ncbi:DASH complex subunit ask1 [Cyberlindnera fabianii]|uniref:DASH complex subunit ASK1 n=1 Tax=Cyberlindnera fabianii TaxID=36022 RepID=A0A1V2L6K6_CYBFA|nr:DASH complex subunit ask1 [Cyberlindnera fabianii]
MAQKYSVTSGSQGNRRKSVFTSSLNNASLSQASAQAIELERLEQEITLVLQGIDKSFAQSHKIINDKLIPIVKRYHQESKKVWSGVNFWKTFLETSANVELRGYEEAVQTELAEEQSINSSERARQNEFRDADISMGDSNEQMSPVKVGTAGTTNHDALMESTNHTTHEFQLRYAEHLRDLNTNADDAAHGKQNDTRPDGQRENPIMPNVANNNVGFDTTDSILPPIPVSANLSNTNNGTDVNQTTPTLLRANTDTDSRHYVMHHNGDTNYKVQVSPRKKHAHEPAVNSLTPKKPASKKRKSMIAQKFDSSPFEIETPKLMSDVQFSPIKQNNPSPLRKQTEIQPTTSDPNDENLTQRFPNTPRYGAGGNLLRTPGQVSRVANRYSQNFEPSTDADNRKDIATATTLGVDDSEEGPSMSPPVTLHFATATNAQNMRKTPAREAAHNIVKDLLHNVSGIDDSTNDVIYHDATSTIRDDAKVKEKEDRSGKGDGKPLEDGFDEFLDQPPDANKGEDWSDE